MSPRLTVGRIAEQAGISASAVRYYERHGIIPRATRSTNGYRVYSPETVELLRFLKRAQALGLRLDEIAELLRLAAGGQRPCTRVRDLARAHLHEVERKIDDLQALRQQLRRLLRRPSSPSGPSQVCPLVEHD